MAAMNLLSTYFANRTGVVFMLFLIFAPASLMLLSAAAGGSRLGSFRRHTAPAGTVWLRAALLLCAVVLLPLTAGNVVAQGICGSNNWIPVEDWGQLENALNPNVDCTPVTINIKLKDNFTSGDGPNGALVVQSNTIVTLDLNGKTINRNLSSPVQNGYVIGVEGKLTIQGGGKITGGNNNNNDINTGGGVCVAENGNFTMVNGMISGNKVKSNLGGGGVFVGVGGTFTMNGGTISDNEAEGITDDGYGGGVFVSSGSTFNMSGGSIKGNQSYNNGGGVYLSDSYSLFKISGSPKVIDNNGGIGSKDDNVYLNSGSVITISGDLDNPQIGVKMQKPGGDVFTNGLKDHNGSLAFFSNDEPEYRVRWDDNITEARLTKVYSIKIDEEIEHGKIESAPSDKAAARESVVLTVSPDPGYMLKPGSLQVTKNSKTDIPVTVVSEEEEKYSFEMPTDFSDSTDHVFITAEFVEQEQETYHVTVTSDNADHGSAFMLISGKEVNEFEGSSGTKVKLRAKSEKGYRFKEWILDPKNAGTLSDDDTYSIGTADVTITAVFEEMKNEKILPVRFEHVMQDCTPSIPPDIAPLTWDNLRLKISKDGKTHTSETFSLDINPGDRYSPLTGKAEVRFSSDLDVDALSADYAFELTGYDPEVSADYDSEEPVPVKIYKVTVDSIAPENDEENRVFLQIHMRWDDGSGNSGWHPEEIAVYALPEDEIGAYMLYSDGTKEYLLFHTYELCMMYLGSDELCSGPERCFHK